MKFLCMAIGAALLMSASPLLADDRDAYNGKWILDLEKSSGESAREQAVFSEMNLELEGENLHIKRRKILKTGKAQKEEYTYVCDGQSQDIEVEGAPKRAANAAWEGTDLKIHSVASQMGSEFTVDTVWTLKSADHLEITNDLKHPLSTRTWTEVYTRKASK